MYTGGNQEYSVWCKLEEIRNSWFVVHWRKSRIFGLVYTRGNQERKNIWFSVHIEEIRNIWFGMEEKNGGSYFVLAVKYI